MKNLIVALALGAAAVPALAQTGVSITVGEPGFYGRIDIGNAPRPPVYVAQPVIVEREVRYAGEPVYLRVPPGHRKKWDKHCHHYDACGKRVLFVRDDWYSNVYAPRLREADHSGDHGQGGGRHEGHGRGHGKDKH